MPNPTPTQKRRAYLSTPADVANSLLARIDASHDEGYRLLRIGARDLDDALTMYPGSVTVIAGRPGMGKSLICKCIANSEHGRIERDGTSDRECVVYVTLEEPQEKLAVQIGGLPFAWRDVMRGTLPNIEDARRAAIGVAKVLRNLYVIQQVGSLNGKRMPPLTTSQIFDTIEALLDEYGKRPTLVILDYLQLIQGETLRTDKQKTEMVMQASNGAVRIARALRVPVVMAVQASRDADDNNPPIPRIKDMQHSSAIEQDADIILGLCRPAAVDRIQDEIAKNGSARVNIGKRDVKVTDSLMIVSPLKARDDGGAGLRYGIHVDPVTLEIHEIDWRHGE